MKKILKETINDLYLNPILTIKKLRLTHIGDILWPLLLGGFILGLSIELRNLNLGLYVGLTWIQTLIMFCGSLIITLLSFLIFLYILPLLIYKFEFMLFNINKNLKKLSQVLALLAPLYAVGILTKVLLDIFFPEHAFFKFIELLIPALTQLYAVAILFVAITYHFRLDDIKGIIVTSLPWVLMLIFKMV